MNSWSERRLGMRALSGGLSGDGKKTEKCNKYLRMTCVCIEMWNLLADL